MSREIKPLTLKLILQVLCQLSYDHDDNCSLKHLSSWTLLKDDDKTLEDFLYFLQNLDIHS